MRIICVRFSIVSLHLGKRYGAIDYSAGNRSIAGHNALKRTMVYIIAATLALLLALPVAAETGEPQWNEKDLSV